MKTTNQSRSRRTFAAVREMLGELDYANRRSLELRTGVPFLKPEQRHDALPARLSDVELLRYDDPRLADSEV
jgi:hypothetical protein